jgi:peptidoglycan biosynthesis protein MviN/MurJ (putative lipid II flippase)
MYCIGAFGLAATNMVSRGFYAVQNTVLPMVVSSLAALCSLPLYWVFLHRNGAPGIALVGSLFMMVQFVVLAGIWTKRYHGEAELNHLLWTLGKILIISAAGGGLCFGITAALGQASVVQGLSNAPRHLLVLGASGIPAALMIFLAFDRLGIADLPSIVSRILRRKG